MCIGRGILAAWESRFLLRPHANLLVDANLPDRADAATPCTKTFIVDSTRCPRQRLHTGYCYHVSTQVLHRIKKTKRHTGARTYYTIVQVMCWWVNIVQEQKKEIKAKTRTARHLLPLGRRHLKCPVHPIFRIVAVTIHHFDRCIVRGSKPTDERRRGAQRRRCPRRTGK